MRGKGLRGWLQTSTTTWDDVMPFRIIRGGCCIPCTHAPRELEPSRLAAPICYRESCVRHGNRQGLLPLVLAVHKL